MANFDFSPYAVAGATRPDSFSGLDPAFRASLEQLFQGAPSEIQQGLRVMSGFRSNDRQAELWQGALAKYGSPEAARKWVAPPGNSKHNHGQAVDLRYLSPVAQKWAHENAGKYGLHFPLSNENWHIEPVGSRGGHNHAPQAPGTPAPAMAPGQMIADRPIAEGAPAQVAAAPAAQPQGQGGFGTLFANMAPMAAAMPVAEPEPIQFGGTGAEMQGAVNAEQGAERARGLRAQLMPDIAALLELGKGPRKVG